MHRFFSKRASSCIYCVFKHFAARSPDPLSSFLGSESGPWVLLTGSPFWEGKCVVCVCCAVCVCGEYHEVSNACWWHVLRRVLDRCDAVCHPCATRKKKAFGDNASIYLADPSIAHIHHTNGCPSEFCDTLRSEVSTILRDWQSWIMDELCLEFVKEI